MALSVIETARETHGRVATLGFSVGEDLSLPATTKPRAQTRPSTIAGSLPDVRVWLARHTNARNLLLP